jgi:hypothetical protein
MQSQGAFYTRKYELSKSFHQSLRNSLNISSIPDINSPDEFDALMNSLAALEKATFLQNAKEEAIIRRKIMIAEERKIESEIKKIDSDLFQRPVLTVLLAFAVLNFGLGTQNAIENLQKSIEGPFKDLSNLLRLSALGIIVAIGNFFAGFTNNRK